MVIHIARFLKLMITNGKKGEDVHIVKVDDEKFIRTDKNETKKDNLGNLPEF